MIKLIKDVTEREDTCYFEFLPGTYKGECWNKESVFIYFLHICYIEPILEKHINGYDHYSFMSAAKSDWQNIIEELNQMKEVLRKAQNLNEFTSKLNFSFQDFEENFTKDFEKSKTGLSKLIDDFVLWLQETLKHHNKISVLGM